MERIKALLHIVAKHNTDHDLYCFFMDPENKVALAGYRRLYGCGDCLVRIHTDDLKLPEGIPAVPGNYFYQDQNYYVNFMGLQGKELPDGREVVNAEVAQYKFNDVFQQIMATKEDERFSVMLNPKMVCEFIEERTANQGFADRKINIQVFDGVSALGQFPVPIGIDQNGQVVARLKNPQSSTGWEDAYIVEDKSLIPVTRLSEKLLYIAERVGVVEGRKYVRILREFKRGIRFAIQYFRSGLLLPNQARYSIYEEKDNKISSADILDVPFIEGQQGRFLKAPILHIDLDTLYRALKPMEMYKVAELTFKDSVTGIIVTGLPEPGQMRVDAIIGPTSPYKSGKVYTA